MRSATSVLLRAIPAGLVLLFILPARAQGPEVWVVTQASRQVFVLDPSTNQLVGAFDISDPDGDGQIEVPAGGLAFGTVPDTGKGFGFITYDDGTLAVVDVPGRGILRSQDLRALLSGSACHPATISGLSLGGARASVPRRFDGPSGPVIRSYLFVAATTSAGEAIGVVLDQEDLISGARSPLVDCVRLRSNATALDVQVLESPAGPQHVRAWFAVRGEGPPADLQAILTFLPPALGGRMTLADRRTTMPPSSSPPPDLLKPLGAPFGRELPVWSLVGGNALQNLDTGGECPLGFAPVQVAVTGIGPNSYEVWALSRETNELVEIDPTSCDVCPTGVGLQPVAVAFLGPIRFRSAFTANYQSDSVTRVDKDGAVKTIALGPPPGGTCTSCPVAIGIAQQPLCDVELKSVDLVDTDGNDLADTVHLNWDGIGCGDAREYLVACQCMTSDPDCPCRCHCPDPLGQCECPGICSAAPGSEATGLALQVPPWDPDPTTNPWRPLGVTSDEEFDQPVQEGNESGVAYGVTPVEP